MAADTAQAVSTQPASPPPSVAPAGQGSSPPSASGAVAAAQPTPAPAAQFPDAVWVDSTVHYAGAIGAERAPATAPVAASADETAGSPPATASTQTAQPVQTPAGEPALAREPQPITESVVESRIQAALDAARKRWDREAQERQARDAEAKVEESRAAERAALRSLWQKWKTEGDAEAGTRVLEALGAPLDLEITAETVRPHVQAAEQAARSAIWQQHLASFGVTEDDDVRAAPDFKTLNTTLLKRSADDAVLNAAWENPKLQARHKTELDAAIKAAKEAAFNNGMATVIGEHPGPELHGSGNGTGRPESLEDIERAFADNPDDPTLLDKYRQVRRARGYRP